MSRRERRVAAKGLRKALRVLGAVVGSTVTFALATAGGVILHIGTPPGRRFVAQTVNGILSTSFKGTVTIEQVHRLGLGGLDAARVIIRDPMGKPVLELDGVSVDLSVPTVLRSVIAGNGNMVIHVTHARVRHIEVVLETDPLGVLTLQRTFEPKKESPPSPGGRGLDLTLSDVVLDHAWIHGSIAASAPPIDVEIHRARAAFHDDPEAMTIDVPRLDLEARGLPKRADPRGTIEAHARVPSRMPGQPADASVSFDGWVAEQKTVLTGKIDGKSVTARLDVPAIDPATLAEAMNGEILHDPGALHLEVDGTLPEVNARAHVALGAGTVDVQADARVEALILANVTVVARGIDPHTFAPGSGHASLGATAKASFQTAGGLIDGRFTFESPATVFAGQVVPAAHVVGGFTQDSAHGTANIDEVGAPTEVDFNVHPVSGPGSMTVVDVDANVLATELGHVRRLAHAATGRAHLRARGRLNLPELRVSGNAEADVERIVASQGEIRLLTGRLDAKVNGPIADVAIDGHLRGDSLVLQEYAFRKFDVRTTGTVRSAHVVASLTGENTADVHLDANVRTGGATTVDNAVLELHRKDVNLVARVGRLRVGGGVTSIENVTIDGMGKLPVQADVTLGPGSIAVKAKGGNVDLGRVGRLLNLEDKIQDGQVAFDVDVKSTAKDARGKVRIDLEGGKFAEVNGASGRLEATFDGRHLTTELRAAVGEMGWITVAANDVVLAGGLLEPGSWRTATGHVLVDTSLDLAKVASEIPAANVPFERASGRVKLQARIGRDHGGDLPDVDTQIATEGLVYVARRPEAKGAAPPAAGEDASLSPPFQTHGEDVELALHVKGKTNDTNFALRVKDKHGTLVQVSGAGTPPYQRLLANAGTAMAELENLPIKLDVIVPSRSFAEFPEFAKISGVRGIVEGAVSLTGTAREPHLDVKARAFDFSSADSSHGKMVNVEMHATYEGTKADVSVKVARPEGFVMEADAGADVRVAELLSGTGAALPWDAKAKVSFKAFPLEAVPMVAANEVRGSLTGSVTLDGLHKDAKLDANLGLSNLRVGHTQYKDGTLTVRAENGALTAGARLNQTDGYAEVHASTAMTWGAELAPALDEKKPLEVSFKAQAFRAAVAQPFLGDTVADLDGRIDADTKLTYDVHAKNGKVIGSVNLRDGQFDVPSAGGEFHAVRARVTMNPFGTVHVADVSANGATGRLTADATVKLDGLQLRSADGKLHIAKGQKLPLELQGVPMGDAWGEVDVKMQMSPDGKKLTANVDIPSLHVQLPQSTGHTVQPLDPNADVRIGVHETAGAFARVNLAKPEKPRPASSSNVHLAVKFGDDVWVTRDTMLKIQLHGGPVVDITDKAKVSGRISSNQGSVEVQSKKFEVDHATVSFVGDDPSDPQIVATAYWDAPSKTRVFVDVTGTPKDLKVTFRSEPEQLPQDAILSLILFGDENGSMGSSQSGSTTDDEDKGVGMAGGVVTQGLNKAISGVTSVDITTRVDTSESQNPRPELAVQVTKDVTATVAYNLGLPPPGQNPDRTQVILDYRFMRHWSLLTTFGDAGSTIVDALWQYRY